MNNTQDPVPVPVLVQKVDTFETSEDHVAVTGNTVRLYVHIQAVVTKKRP